MRNIFIKAIAVLAVLAAFAGCEKSEQKSPEALALIGEWHFENEAEAVAEKESVYIAFNADDTFELFQKIGDGPYLKLEGTYSVFGYVVSGVYNGGTPWKSQYDFDVEGETLTMTSIDVAEHVIVYKKKAIPAEVRNHFDSPTKAAEVLPFL